MVHTRTAAAYGIITAFDAGDRLAQRAAGQLLQRIHPRFAELLATGSQPVVAFRVGHPTQDARPSPRRNLTDVIR